MIARIQHNRRRLYLDDILLMFGVVCLCGASGLVLNYSRTIFNYKTFNSSNSKSSRAIIRASCFLAWTTIYCVKLSFIALFTKLVGRTSKRLIFFGRLGATCTFVSWIGAVSCMFIVCPYFGLESGNITFYPSFQTRFQC